MSILNLWLQHLIYCIFNNIADFKFVDELSTIEALPRLFKVTS